MVTDLTEIGNEIRECVKNYLIDAVEDGSYNYTTFGKVVEDLVADSLDLFFHDTYGIEKRDCIRAKNKNTFPDYHLLDKHAIEFKAAIATGNPENDLGTINSWPKKISIWGEDNIYFLFIKYSSNNNAVLILDVYFDNFYKFIGKSNLSTLKYREKDGNLRPKSWNDFSSGTNYWNSVEEFNNAFIATISVRARRLVEKHFLDMTRDDQMQFIKSARKVVSNDTEH